MMAVMGGSNHQDTHALGMLGQDQACMTFLGFKDDVLHLPLCHKGEDFKSGNTEDREVRLSRRSIRLIPQSLDLSREEISKRILEIDSGDGAWEGAVFLLSRQLICDVEENLARRTALDLVAHVVLLCLQEEFLHIFALVDEDLFSPAPFSTSSWMLRLLVLHCKPGWEGRSVMRRCLRGACWSRTSRRPEL